MRNFTAERRSEITDMNSDFWSLFLAIAVAIVCFYGAISILGAVMLGALSRNKENEN